MDPMASLPLGMFDPPSKEDALNTYNPRCKRRVDSKPKEKRSFKGRALSSYDFYFFVAVNANGEIEYDSSAKVDFSQDKTVGDAVQRMIQMDHKQKQGDGEFVDDQQEPQLKQRHHMSQSWANNPPPPELLGSYMPPDQIPYPTQTNSKRRRVDCQSPESSHLQISAPPSVKPPSIPTVQYGSHTDLSAVSANSQAPITQPVLNIKVSDREKWTEWFTNAFLAVQQQYCRLIAKEWIRLLHPKKQSTHPYNGKIPRNQKACPNRTKPPYWPIDVMHKEPDHIDKDSRTRLLVHIIMNTPQNEITSHNPDGHFDGKSFTAEKLLEPLWKKKEELKDKWWIIEEAIQARTTLEMYEAGGCDDDQEVAVPDFEDHSRNASKEKKQKGKSQVKDDNGPESVKFNESRASTPIVIDSPANSAFTPSESENEDSAPPMDTSFTSTSTQASTRSVAQMLRPKAEVPPSNHVNMMAQAPASQHPMLIDSVSSQLALDYDQRNLTHHPQPNPPVSWTDPRMNSIVPYAHEMMMTTQPPSSALAMHDYQPPMYNQTQSHSTQVASFNGQSSFQYGFVNDDTFPSTQNLDQIGYPSQDDYMRAMHGQQRSRY